MIRSLPLFIAAALLLSAPAYAEAAHAHRSHHRLHHHRSHHRRRRHHRRHRHHQHHRRHRHHYRQSRHAATSNFCPGADLTPDAQNLTNVEAATLCLINRARADHGVPALRDDARLDRAAEGHSRDMVERGYFEHLSPGGQTPLQRVRASGFVSGSRGLAVAENIAWGSLWLATPREIVRSWMTSPGHRDNILSRAYRFTGIGVAPHVPDGLADGQRGAVYTQDFAALLS